MANLQILFGSKSRVSILSLLFNCDHKPLSVNEIIRKAEVNAKIASPELRKLESIEILISQKVSNSLLYTVNEDSSLYKPLSEIFGEQKWRGWERPSRIHHLALTLEAGLKPMKEYYGYCLPSAHLVFNYDNVTWYFKPNEFINTGKKLIPIYEKKKERIWKDFRKYASTLSDHKTYKSFYKNYINFWKVAYITEPISFYIDSLLKPNEQISISDKSFTQDYEEGIWELAKKARKCGIKNINLSPFIKKYFWIRNSYHGIHRLTEEEVKTEIRKKIGKKRPKPQKVKDPVSISKNLLNLGKDMVLMQDERKMYMMEAAYYLHEFLKSIGEKYNLSPAMMVQTLPQEVLKMGNIPKLKEELKARQRSCTVTGSLAGGIKIRSGEMILPEGLQRRTILEIRGRVACGGKAAGRAKIVGSLKDMYKVNHGDIIISPMTSPELVPAIRRSVAIVTDFGGITCHAAIISREFNIPCIVGTENATKLIKDKDLVEVDADSGIVKILESGR